MSMTFAPDSRIFGASSADVSFGVARKTTSGRLASRRPSEKGSASGPAAPPRSGCSRANGTARESFFPEKNRDTISAWGCRASSTHSSAPEYPVAPRTATLVFRSNFARSTAPPAGAPHGEARLEAARQPLGGRDRGRREEDRVVAGDRPDDPFERGLVQGARYRVGRRGRRLDDDEVARRLHAQYPLAERALEPLLTAGLKLRIPGLRVAARIDISRSRLREAEVLEVPGESGLRHVDAAAREAMLQLLLRVHGAVADDPEDLVAAAEPHRMTIHTREYSFICATRQAFSFRDAGHAAGGPGGLELEAWGTTLPDEPGRDGSDPLFRPVRNRDWETAGEVASFFPVPWRAHRR